MRFRTTFIGCAISIILTACATMNFSPTNEYRESLPYRSHNFKGLLKQDTIKIQPLIISSGVQHKNNLLDSILLKNHFLSERVIETIESHLTSHEVTVPTLGFKTRHGRNFFDKYIRTQKSSFNYSDHTGISFISYLELSVRTGPEFDGGGGISFAYPTGNRKYWITYGMIIEMQQDGRKVYSRGFYYTEFKKVPGEAEMTFDFPAQRLDSLLSLCMKDLPKEMFSK